MDMIDCTLEVGLFSAYSQLDLLSSSEQIMP